MAQLKQVEKYDGEETTLEYRAVFLVKTQIQRVCFLGDELERLEKRRRIPAGGYEKKLEAIRHAVDELLTPAPAKEE